MKTCCRCRKTLPIDKFHKHSQKRDGLNPWCKDCEFKRNVIRRGFPKWRRRTGDTTLCPKCLINERGSQPYCPNCKKEYQNRTRAKKWSERYVGNEAKRIETARQYATGLLRRGKIKREDCVFCGNPGTQFHHYDYERKTLNFDDVCDLCHSQVHRFLEILLTLSILRRKSPISCP